MQIMTPTDYIGVVKDHPFSALFDIFAFKDGARSLIPKNCFINWMGGYAEIGVCY